MEKKSTANSPKIADDENFIRNVEGMIEPSGAAGSRCIL